MQQELSEITEDTVEEARQALEEATEEEETIAENLENADKEVVDEKKKLAKVGQIGFGNKEIGRSRSPAGFSLGPAGSAGESFEELPRPGRAARYCEEAKEGAKPEEAIAELAQTAQDLVEPLLEEAAGWPKPPNRPRSSS